MQALIDGAPYEGGELAFVLSSHAGAYALERAEKAGIPHETLEPSAFADRESYTEAVIERLLAREIDLVVLAGFMFILSPRFTQVFPKKVINVHPALIPAFCGKGFYGLRVHRAALDYGVKVTGATVHFVTEITDGGPIISQKAIDIFDGDTPESLQLRVMEQCERPLLVGAVRGLCAERGMSDGG